MIFVLEPHEQKALVQAFITSAPFPTEVDFIQEFTGIPNLTHAWNEFGLRAEVVAKVAQQ
jgi:hypothetical protein